MSMGDYQRGYDDAMAQLRSNPEDWVPVKAKVGKASAVFSMRFAPEELDALRLRAKEAGTTISGFIRSAALQAANPPLAEVGGWCRRCDTKWDGLGEWVLVLEEEQTKNSPFAVTVTIRKSEEPL